MSLTTTLITLCLGVLQAQAPASAPPADLAVVVRAAQESSMPAAERDKLLGQEYAGMITINSVRMSPDGAATIEAETQPDAGKPGVRVRFVTTGTDTVLDTLSRGKVLRVRARLTAFSGTATSPVLNFVEMAVVPARNMSTNL
jgi:hypothetical protein